MIKNHFKLEKLKIKAFSTIEREAKDHVETFEVMFNPESYSLEYENVYDESEGRITNTAKTKYINQRPANLSLDLIFDDSGVVPSKSSSIPGYVGSSIPGASFVNKLRGKNNVHAQVEQFRKLTTKVDGEIHEPYFLIIQWGQLSYKCRLKSFEVGYTLFDRGGNPIRAELTAQFVYSLNEFEKARLDNLSSPDLTHSRTIKSEDTLPLVAQKMYGDPGYHVKLARANNLNSLRKLTVGKTLKLPPIEK